MGVGEVRLNGRRQPGKRESALTGKGQSVPVLWGKFQEREPGGQPSAELGTGAERYRMRLEVDRVQPLREPRQSRGSHQ